MAKKNRPPRPTVDEEYLHTGDVIPGTQLVADHDGWYYPWKYEEFKYGEYRNWMRAKEAEWEASQVIAQGGPVVFPIP